VREIPVDQWETCIVNKITYQTSRRVWSFAQTNFSTPVGTNRVFAVPVQGIFNTSISLPNGTQVVEFDAIYNIYSYRFGIVESNDQLVPPKGIFCNSGPNQNLISLQDAGIQWPVRFGVRVEASTSRSSAWRGFHLRYERDRDSNSRRIRYDYIPPGAEDFQTVIHDYDANITYIIDRGIGSCTIQRGVEVPDVDPVQDPIRFFIKNEERFLYRSDDKIWEFNGFRRMI
jgi:hypothetical protein